MKKPLSIILLSALMVALTATGCSNPVGDLIQPSGSVDASSAEPTVQPTDTPATASTQDRQYTAMELADMSLDEIKALMGGEYTSEHVQLSNAFSSDGTSYVFNYAVLPGFAFETYENDYRGISIMDGAKLDDRISSDMTYTQIADMIGEMDGRIIGQEGNIVCTKIMNGYQVSFCFIENEYIRSNKERDRNNRGDHDSHFYIGTGRFYKAGRFRTSGNNHLNITDQIHHLFEIFLDIFTMFCFIS